MHFWDLVSCSSKVTAYSSVFQHILWRGILATDNIHICSINDNDNNNNTCAKCQSDIVSGCWVLKLIFSVNNPGLSQHTAQLAQTHKILGHHWVISQFKYDIASTVLQIYVHVMSRQVVNAHGSEKLVVDAISRQFEVSLLHHSVLYFNSNTYLPFLVYFIAQVCIFQLKTTSTTRLGCTSCSHINNRPESWVSK